MVLPSGLEPEQMVPKTIVLSITPREQILYLYEKLYAFLMFFSSKIKN